MQKINDTFSILVEQVRKRLIECEFREHVTYSVSLLRSHAKKMLKVEIPGHGRYILYLWHIRC